MLCVLSDDGGRYGLFDVDSWRGGGDEGSSGEGVESDGGVGEVE